MTHIMNITLTSQLGLCHASQPTGSLSLSTCWLLSFSLSVKLLRLCLCRCALLATALARAVVSPAPSQCGPSTQSPQFPGIWDSAKNHNIGKKGQKMIYYSKEYCVHQTLIDTMIDLSCKQITKGKTTTLLGPSPTTQSQKSMTHIHGESLFMSHIKTSIYEDHFIETSMTSKFSDRINLNKMNKYYLLTCIVLMTNQGQIISRLHHKRQIDLCHPHSKNYPL